MPSLSSDAFNRCTLARTFGLTSSSRPSANRALCGPIHEAVKAGDVQKVKALLTVNPDLVDSKDGYGTTPLHYAAAYDHQDVAELLLNYKADANAKNGEGSTPLQFAAASGIPPT